MQKQIYFVTTQYFNVNKIEHIFQLNVIQLTNIHVLKNTQLCDLLDKQFITCKYH